MDREALLTYVREQFAVEPDYPWAKYPNHCVLRHLGNRKWFAAVLEVSRKTLGLAGEGTADVLNVKCDPLLLGSLLESDGFLPAYHMSKTNWVSILLDGSVAEEEIVNLLTMSYEMTKGKRPTRKKGAQHEPI